MRPISRLFVAFAAAISLVAAAPIPSNAANLSDSSSASEEPDRVIYVDAPAPRVSDDATVVSRSESLEVKTSPESLLEYPVADGEHLMVVYTDGIVHATKAGKCTVTTSSYKPTKKSNKANATGAFSRSSACGNETAKIYLYQGIVNYADNSAYVYGNGATVVISASKHCDYGFNSTWYGLGTWSTGGSSKSPTATLPCRPI